MIDFEIKIILKLYIPFEFIITKNATVFFSEKDATVGKFSVQQFH